MAMVIGLFFCDFENIGIPQEFNHFTRVQVKLIRSQEALRVSTTWDRSRNTGFKYKFGYILFKWEGKTYVRTPRRLVNICHTFSSIQGPMPTPKDQYEAVWETKFCAKNLSKTDYSKITKSIANITALNDSPEIEDNKLVYSSPCIFRRWGFEAFYDYDDDEHGEMKGAENTDNVIMSLAQDFRSKRCMENWVNVEEHIPPSKSCRTHSVRILPQIPLLRSKFIVVLKGIGSETCRCRPNDLVNNCLAELRTANVDSLDKDCWLCKSKHICVQYGMQNLPVFYRNERDTDNWCAFRESMEECLPDENNIENDIDMEQEEDSDKFNYDDMQLDD
jgi:hypothetical protein